MSNRYEDTDASPARASVLGEGAVYGEVEVPAGKMALMLGDPGATALVVTGTWAELNAWHDHVGLMLSIPMLTIKIESTYVCGREVEATCQVPVPEEGVDLDDWWWSDLDLPSGDGHTHPENKRTEHALYEFTIIAAPPGYENLIGEHSQSEG